MVFRAHDSSSSSADSPRPKRRDPARRVGWAKQPPAGRSRAHRRPAHAEPMVGTARDEVQRATRIGARLCPPYPAATASVSEAIQGDTDSLDGFVASLLAMTMGAAATPHSAAPHTRCHRPARPGDPVRRGGLDKLDRPRRTGYPAFAGYDGGVCGCIGRAKAPCSAASTHSAVAARGPPSSSMDAPRWARRAIHHA